MYAFLKRFSPQIYENDVKRFGRGKDSKPPYCRFLVQALKDSSRTFTYAIDIREIESPETITFVVHNIEGNNEWVYAFVLNYILDWLICVL